ncbi:hypothetical protein RYH80_09715 [Halobaculum sp. MBLA0147]|uniref:DUF7351 domain-containing protein n=1 Tax=Halobaculum sp. MBLA0147 TaxID=3079934 RepID=UPI003523FF84
MSDDTGGDGGRDDDRSGRETAGDDTSGDDTTITDASAVDPVAAFACLGDETRLSILEALYERARADDGPGQRAVPYSELQAAAGVEDSGKFNYHLTELREFFVSKSEGGYSLDQTGATVARLVLGNFGAGDPTLSEPAAETACPQCGGTVVVSYDDQRVTTRCRDCPGHTADPAVPTGTLSSLEYPPAGVAGRSGRQVLERVHLRYELECAAMAADVCPTCGGGVASELAVCSDHDDEGICETCSYALGAVVGLACTVCGLHHVSPVAFARTDSPVVTAALATTDGDATAWERFATAAGWPVEPIETDEGLRVAVDPPDGPRFVVDDDLRIGPPATGDQDDDEWDAADADDEWDAPTGTPPRPWGGSP